MKNNLLPLKLIIILLSLVMCHATSIAQYTVTKIVGQVSNKSTGENLRPGSKLKDDDLLQFSSEKDMVRVIVSGKGVYVISPTPAKDKSSNMIVEMLKTALKIKSREGYLSGRSEETSMIPEALITEPDVNPLLLFTSETRFVFDTIRYKPSNGNRFFLQIEIDGGKSEIHALQTKRDTLFISSRDLQPRQEVSKPKYKLGFYTKDKNSSESLSTIRPYIDSTGEMETLIGLFVSNSQEPDIQKLKQACYAEVYESMGKPSLIDFENVFNRLTSGYSKKQ